MSYNPKLIKEGSIVRLVDNDKGSLTTRRMQRLLDRYVTYFIDFDAKILSSDLTYVQLTELIDKLNARLDVELEIDHEIKAFIAQNRYAINEQKIVGMTIKSYDERWQAELSHFVTIVNREITRPLKPQQIQASFFLTMMKRAANFSVPGAGKTAMMYGTFAYLSALEIDEVNKLLVIAPLNAFEAWRTEYQAVFGDKRALHFMNLKDYVDIGRVRTDWGIADVIVINYESLQGWKLTTLNGLIDDKTMVVFDEVHRIKNPSGKRAQNALQLGQQARYRYVLTGTPIPNSYKDVYNFLHLLYDNEYNTYFGWQVGDLDSPNVAEINDKMQPFFWRTNKQDLQVPPAEADKILTIMPSLEQIELAKVIHAVENNVLSRYIRLLQASTNPALLIEKVDLNNLGFLFDEVNFSFNQALDTEEERQARQRLYLDMDVETMRTPKFDAGMSLIRKLVAEGKKVIVWGMFVGTMRKVQRELLESGIEANLVYGDTPKESRVGLINNFRDGNVPVLISNPATLGESISLHQTVHDAVYFEYNFNLTFMLQSRDRIHRLGLPDNQYTRYYYLMTEGDHAHNGYIDQQVYERLKEKEIIMLNAIDGDMLLPMVEDDYLDDVKRIVT
ncbi:MULTISPECIES: DEAD/DEAH box helicase [Leuconostoc]|uniref:Helicase, SNF2 family n=2 Tax=Leuconostoc kimchii TaxID=136609 RepID=D5T3N3_LEUKI|nr:MULTISPECIES: DEAD/DEAH box helicase [Leuconostoc]ADG40882.1 helicase, SNF2 family [Leuconostoc kimchii IMSNU 11154]AEJ31144.1 helicase, SNF2 family protein [Leuconostoc sp. C2]QBR48233.1 helicase [Leuconostoc kimchii]